MNKEAQLTSKGQVTVTAKILKPMHLKPGDRLVFQDEGEQVTLRRAQKLDTFALYAGRYQEGQGKICEGIDAEVRELRGA